MKDDVLLLLEYRVPASLVDEVIKQAGYEALISQPIREYLFERWDDLVVEVAWICWTIHYLDLPLVMGKKLARKEFRRFCREEGLIRNDDQGRQWQCPVCFPIEVVEDTVTMEDDVIARIDYDLMVGNAKPTMCSRDTRRRVQQWLKR